MRHSRKAAAIEVLAAQAVISTEDSGLVHPIIDLLSWDSSLGVFPRTLQPEDGGNLRESQF